MQLEQEDLYKSWFPNKLSTIQLTNELKDFYNYNKETNIIFDKNNINQEQDAIKKIFPLADDIEINEDSLITHKLYEITNSTDFKIKYNNSIKNISETNNKIFFFKKWFSNI